MPEISLNILDVAENSTRAGASLVHITVDVQPNLDRLTVIIADDGCGMTKEQLERLSDPFLQRGRRGRSDSVFRFSGCLRSRPEDMSK